MDINNILSKLSYLQDTTRGTSIARNAYVPVVAAGMAKFTRAFHNLCDDLVKLNPTSVFALFGNDELHAIVSDVALEAREAADPQHHGDTRKFVDQIQLMIAEEWGAPKEAIFDPNAQGEMIASMRTLASEESVESLGNMCAIFASLAGELPVEVHGALIQELSDTVGEFIKVAENLREICVSEEFFANPPSSSTVKAYVDNTKEVILASNCVSPKEKGDFAERMQQMQPGYLYRGANADAITDLAGEMFRLTVVQHAGITPIYNAIAAMTDILARLDSEVYYPMIQQQGNS